MRKVWCNTDEDVGVVFKYFRENHVMNGYSPNEPRVSAPVGFCFDETNFNYTVLETREEFAATGCTEIPPGAIRYLIDDPVNHPSHYTSGKVECIDAMERVFGKDAVINFAILNAWKYLWRRKGKGAEKQDVKKALWYFDKAKELINDSSE